MPRVDYDQIAHLYDEPIRDHAADEHLVSFLGQRPDLTPESVRILDVGCGTGKQLAADRTRLPGATLLGVDRYRGMLRIARRRAPAIPWVQGDGAHLPLRSATFDYATNQFSYHHMADREGFFREVHRVLRPGGRFVLTNIDPWSMPQWSIYRFFPEARDRDLQDCYSAETLDGVLSSIGFTNVQVSRQHWRPVERLTDALSYVSDRYRTSQLMVLTEAEHEAGLDRLRAEITARGGDATVESETCLMTVVADRAASA
jgi:ubiquinone/menaquinone biosynthesis C-methylase UbiE